MARIPRPYDSAEPGLQPARSVAQIDERVAQRIGSAGNAMGRAIEAIGGAFADVAMRSAEAQDSTNAARAKLDFMKFDNDAWTGLQNGVSQNGDGWERAGDVYKQGVTDIMSKYPVSDPKRRQDLSMFLERQVAERGFQAARQQQSMRGTYYRGIEDQEINGAALRVEANPSQDTVDALRGSLTELVESGRGYYASNAAIEQRKRQIEGALLMGQYRGLLKTDPEAASALMDKIRKGEYELDARFGPSSSAAPAEPGPRGKDYVARSGPGVVTAELSSPRQYNDQGYGARTTGVITVNGRSYEFINGGSRRGSIPNGEYQIGRFTTGPQRASEGRQFTRDAFELSDVKDDSPRGSQEDHRRGLLIHDARGGVTAGCIGIKGDFEQFKRDLAAEQQKNGGRLTLSLGLSGGQASSRTAEAGAVGNGFSPNLTAYSPQATGSSQVGMEGGYAAARPGPDGKAEVRTLADVASGRSNYVTLAGNPAENGKVFTIPRIAYVDGDGKTQVLNNVKGVVHDTGGAFKNAPAGRYDIALDKDADDARMAAAHARWRQDRVQFIPGGGTQSNQGGGTPGRDVIELAGKSAQEITAALDAAHGRGNRDMLFINDSNPRVIARPGQERWQPRDPQAAQFSGPQFANEFLAARPGYSATRLAGQSEDQGNVIPFRTTPQNSFLGEAVGRIQQAAKDAPGTPVAELLSPAQMDQLGKLADANPEVASAINWDNVTVGDVAKLIASREPARSDDGFIPMGRLRSGQSFTVKSKHGDITVSADAVNALDKGMVRKLQQDAKEQLRIKQREQDVIAEDMAKRELLTQESQGKSHSEFDRSVLEQAWRKTPKKLAEFDRRMTIAQSMHEVTADAPNVPNDILQERLDRLKDRVVNEYGDADPAAQAAVDRAEKRVKAIAALRDRDPARAVRDSIEVKSVLAQMPGGKPTNAAHVYQLADATLKAQTRLGLVQTPIDLQTAHVIMGPIMRAPDREKRQAAEAVAQKIIDDYGSLAERVWETAHRLTRGDTQDERDMGGSALRRMRRGQAASTPADVDKAANGAAPKGDRLAPKPNFFDPYE